MQNEENKLRANYDQPRPSRSSKQLKTTKNNLLLSETDPNHAYGPNYYMLPNSLKQYYKYNRMKKYIHPELEDEKERIKFNYIFYFGVLGSCFSTYLGLKGINRFFVKKISLTFFNHFDRYPLVYFAAPASLAGSLGYGYLNSLFIRDYCLPFMEKYRDAAVENGFDDYEISADKGGQSWTNFYHMFKI
jgi:hypothetical protein